MLERLWKIRDEKKKSRKGGFTLVELIVVLVILAILAALLIPALTGYIDKAKEKQIIAETRQTVMAAQTLVDEQWATNSAVYISASKDTTKSGAFVSVGDVKTLAEVNGSIIGDVTVSGGKITVLQYSNNGKYCRYKVTDGAGGSYQTSDAEIKDKQ